MIGNNAPGNAPKPGLKGAGAIVSLKTPKGPVKNFLKHVFRRVLAERRRVAER